MYQVFVLPHHGLRKQCLDHWTTFVDIYMKVLG